jgi:hypothetical protein
MSSTLLSELKQNLIELQSSFRSFLSLSSLANKDDGTISALRTSSSQLKQKQLACSKLVSRCTDAQVLWSDPKTDMEKKEEFFERANIVAFLLSLEPNGVCKSIPFSSSQLFNPKYTGLQVLLSYNYIVLIYYYYF